MTLGRIGVGSLLCWLDALSARALLETKTYRMMWTQTSPPPPPGTDHSRWALGWSAYIAPSGERIFVKDGGLPGGYASYTVYYPDSNTLVGILTNENPEPGNFAGPAQQIVAAATNVPGAEVPAFKDTVSNC